jgi:hypothetical protein
MEHVANVEINRVMEAYFPLFLKAIEYFKNYVATLSEEERVAVEIENFDFQRYRDMTIPADWRAYNCADLIKKDSIYQIHCNSILEKLKEDVKEYRKRKSQQENLKKKENAQGNTQSKIVDLLSRYIKLPSILRFYICKRLNPDFDTTEIGTKLGDIWIFGRFAMIANEDESGKAWDKEYNQKMVAKFESIINEVERVIDITEMVNITPSSKASDKRNSILPEGI